MNEGFITISGTPTHVITWGRWIEASLHDVAEIVLCIPGNPGLVGFYTEFLSSLYEKLGQRIPVWIIGHSGHESAQNCKIEVPCLKENEKLFDLDGQLQHKIEFIQRFVPDNTKIHLIGHSIGAWMVVQLLEHQTIRQRIKKCYLLFPTLERMLDSSNGWNFSKIGLPLYSTLGFIIPLFNRLPKAIQTFCIQLYFWLLNIPKTFIDSALEYSKAPVLEKIIFLAKDEMARVRDLDSKLIEKHLPLLKLYYGTTDGWVPVQYYNELCARFPDIDAELDQEHIDHAFVLRYSESMSRFVSKMIKNHSNLLK